MRTLNYLDCTVPVFSCFLADLHLFHAHIQVPVPLVLVATLLFSRRLTDLQFQRVHKQSSIDLSQIYIALSIVTPPLSTVARNRARARSRGTASSVTFVEEKYSDNPPAYFLFVVGELNNESDGHRNTRKAKRKME